MENFIPAKYNVQSTLRATITRQASAAGIDFALERPAAGYTRLL